MNIPCFVVGVEAVASSNSKSQWMDACPSAGESPSLLVKMQITPGVFGYGQPAIDNGCQEEPVGAQHQSDRARGASHGGYRRDACAVGGASGRVDGLRREQP